MEFKTKYELTRIESDEIEKKMNDIFGSELLGLTRRISIETLNTYRKRLNASEFNTEVKFIELLGKTRSDLIAYRNYPVCNRYFADFFFPYFNLIVEIDGRSHFSVESRAYDFFRDNVLRKYGYSVYRLDIRNYSQWGLSLWCAFNNKPLPTKQRYVKPFEIIISTKKEPRKKRKKKIKKQIYKPGLNQFNSYDGRKKELKLIQTKN